MKKTVAVLVWIALGSMGVRPASAATPAAASAVPVILGHSVVPLTGPWKFHIGDDAKWSDPNLDDSGWEVVDLGAKKESIDPAMGFEGFSPGWTGKGHPGYAGYAWYRMRVRIEGADEPLALLAPNDVDDSYQLFVNGRFIGEFGSFAGSVPTIYYSRPLKFSLPADVLQRRPNGTMLIAFRFYMAPRTLLQTNPGGMHAPPIFGFSSAITAAYHVAWEEQLRAVSAILADAVMYLVFCVLILMLYFFDRAEKILLWPISASFGSAVGLAILFFSLTTQSMSALQQAIVLSALNPLVLGLWLMTWLVYFGLAANKWLRNMIVALMLWAGSTGLMFQLLLLRGVVSHRVFAANTINEFAESAASWALAIAIAYLGWRRPNRERPALFLAFFFAVLPSLEPVLRLLHVRTTWFPSGISIGLNEITDIAMLICFSVVLLRRFRTSQRRQQAMEQDVKQAQEVQQVLIPEELPHIAGLTIESEYRPAREVGGDFFQILPHPSDGSVLIVVGDVTGKGLQAGMLVALIVGAIRAEAAHSNDPLTTLNALNQRLCGRGQAHATGLALRVAADGSATLANAGHLPPYLNGKELPMEGALPLGMTPTATFPVMHFQLAPGDRLLLMSDGVVEAQDKDGQLFGFDR
ncbi:MAG TPA: SpoIIE family protein phosphatase, partial [Acidobacteriaceae bacterium]|nr:SpoIIE family protein phosphatase [Acidobacteriaceae bacterium]